MTLPLRSSAGGSVPEVTEIRRILVVDDEPDITEMYQMLFEMHGYLVSTANNGVEALDRVTEAEPDLILSDCMMPKMDGIEFIRQARLIPELASIPIILMSGAPEQHDFSNCVYTLFLQKPVLFDEVLQKIDKLLKEHTR